MSERTTPGRMLGNAAIVFVGGAAGTGARALLLATVPTDASWTTLAINLGGAFLLAFFAATLFPNHERTRLLVGVGLLGGFTTYSALAFDVANRAASGDWLSLVIAAASLVGGFIVCLLGWMLGHAFRPRRQVDA